MVNCYIHTERQASSSCVICGRGICSECTKWAAGDIYLCPTCWQQNVPVETASEKRKSGRVGPRASLGAALSRALYYATALVIVVIGSWYVYATFIAPAIVASAGTPLTVPAPAPSSLAEIWSRYNLLITISVSMFMIVLVGGELMLRTGPKQARRVATQPQVQPGRQSLMDGPKKSPSVATKTEVAFEPTGQKESKAAATQPKVQAVTQTLPAGPKPSQPVRTQPELQPPTQTRMVYCIYCGNKIPSAALFCNKCGKGQR